MYQEQHRFSLPRGFVIDGGICKDGVMRLATAGDEIKALSGHKSRQNPDYVSIILLSLVIIGLDGYGGKVTPEMIEGLTLPDYKFLQDMYSTVNDAEDMRIRVTCPKCGEVFYETVNFHDPV